MSGGIQEFRFVKEGLISVFCIQVLVHCIIVLGIWESCVQIMLHIYRYLKI